MNARTCTIEDFVDFVGGNAFALKFQKKQKGEIPFYKVSDMNNPGNEKYMTTAAYYVSKELAREQKWSIIPSGSVIFAKIGAAINLNRTRMITTDSIIDNNLMAAVPKSIVISDYLYLVFEKLDYRKYVNSGFPPSLNMTLLRKAKVSVTDLESQESITRHVCKWDESIELITRLIEKKKRFRYAMMEKLLTGQVRFAEYGSLTGQNRGIPEGWNIFKLKDVAKILISNVDKKSYPGQKAIQLCNYLDVYNNKYIDASLDFMKATASEDEVKKFSLYASDILITKDSETADDIGVPAIIKDNIKDLVCGYHLAIIRCKIGIIYPLFLFMAMQSQHSKTQFSRLANGVTRFGLAAGDIGKIEILIPQNIEEQKKIALTISKLDSEIESLIGAKEQYVKQKKGIMSLLLN